ncbi:MAG: hypothetical protein FWD73_14970 [Polyangiaceae bacterium]|nr:hypothetical protein [Polyangiaceae bacterium]
MKDRNFAYGLVIGATLTALMLLALTSLRRKRFRTHTAYQVRGNVESGSFLDTDTENKDSTLCDESRSAEPEPELESERRDVEGDAERW